MNIYLAAPLTQAITMRLWADRFRIARFTVVSHWHDVVSEGAVDPVNPTARVAVLYTNLAHLDAADIVFADTREGKPAATHSEIGWALARDKPVIWLQPPTRRPDGERATSIFDAHSVAFPVFDEAEVIPKVKQIAAWLRELPFACTA